MMDAKETEQGIEPVELDKLLGTWGLEEQRDKELSTRGVLLNSLDSRKNDDSFLTQKKSAKNW